MQSFTFLSTLMAAGLSAALPTGQLSASTTTVATTSTKSEALAAPTEVRTQIERDAGASGIQTEVPVGELIEAGTSPFGVDSDIFAIRLRGDAEGLECVFNYVFEQRENRQALISVGNDFQAGGPSASVSPIDFRCD